MKNKNTSQTSSKKPQTGANRSSRLQPIDTEYLRLRAAYGTVPTLAQLQAMEQLAGRLTLVDPASELGAEIDEVKPDNEQYHYKDKSSDEPVDPEVAAELLQQVDRYNWLLDEVGLYEAGIVSRIPPDAGWDTLSAAQQHSLKAWQARYPELSSVNILAVGPGDAHARLQLHHALTAKRHPAAHGADEPAEQAGPPSEKIADRMSRVEAALNGLSGKMRSRKPSKPTGAAAPQIIQPTQAPPAGPPPLDGALKAEVEPNHTYIEVDNINEAIWTEIVAQGLRPPETTNGFIKLDPYGTTYSLSDAVVYYFDKVDLDIPDGHLPYLVKHLAFYNNLIKVADRELQAGQYLWFPSRDVLEAWANETLPSSSKT